MVHKHLEMIGLRFSTHLVAGSCSVLLAIAAGLPAQGRIQVEAPPDPYTKNDPAVLKQLGYESLGPFAFGTNQTSESIETLLGTEPLMWVETEHFRLGCALPGIPMKGREEWRRGWQKKVYAELLELRATLPSIKKKPKQLDPWLRTHLYALRLEKLYSEVSQLLGVEDAWFPMQRGDAARRQAFRGNGPFLGMAEKFTVLILRTKASHARYMRAYHGFEMGEPMRMHDLPFGCLYWGCSLETANGLFRQDPALHANAVFNIAHNLYTSFRGYGHDLPAWIATGLGHWHSRRVSPRFPTYDRKDDRDEDARSAFWQWDLRVQGLVKHNVFEQTETFIERLDAGKYGVEQHMQSWALVRYLLQEKKPQFVSFLHRMKDPFHAMRRLPTPQELLTRQRAVLEEAFGCEVKDLDTEWRADELATKRRKRRLGP